MMAPLDYLQRAYVGSFLSGSKRDPQFDFLESEILNHYELDAIMRRHIQKNTKRRIHVLPQWNDDYVPGVMQRNQIEKRPGEFRTVWAPNDPDYAMGLRMYYGFAVPLLAATAHPDTHGFIPNRGTNTAVKSIASVIHSQRGEVEVIQSDIKDCFPTIRVNGMTSDLTPGRLGRYVEQIHHRYKAADSDSRQPGNGLPQGHPISPIIVAMIIDHIIRHVRGKWFNYAKIIVYCDDLTVLAADKMTASEVFTEIELELQRHGIRLNHSKTNRADMKRGEAIECLGFKMQWLNALTTIRIGPKDSAYQQLSEKLAETVGRAAAQQTINGWYHAYAGLANDPQFLDRMNAAINAARAF